MTASSPEDRKKSGGRVFLVRILWIIPALVPALILVLFLGAPYILERGLLARMENMGVQDPRLRVESITPRGIIVSGVGGKNLGPEADFVFLGFKWQSLLKGRLDRIVVSGLSWDIELGRDEVDLGLPIQLDRDPGQEQDKIYFLPFESLEIKSSSLQIRHAGFGWQAPVRGMLEIPETGLLEARFETRLLGSTVHILGRSSLQTGKTRIFAQSRWPWTDLGEDPDPDSLPFQAGLDLEWKQNGHDPGVAGLDLFVRLDRQEINARGVSLGVGHARLNVQAEAGADLTWEKLDADLRLEDFRFREYVFSSLDLDVQDLGSLVQLKASMEDPAFLEIIAEGKQTDINALLAGDFAWSGQWDFALTGELTAGLVNSIAPEKIEISRALPARFSGRLQAGMEPGSEYRAWEVNAGIHEGWIGPGDIFWPAQNVNIRELFLHILPQVRVSPGKTVVMLEKQSALHARAVSMVHDEETYTLHGLKIGGPGTWAVMDLDQETGARIQLDAHVQDRFTVDSQVLQAEFATGRIRSDLVLAESDPRGHVILELEQGKALLAEHDIHLKGIHLALPYIMQEADIQPGSWSFREIVHAGRAFSGAQGTVIIRDSHLQGQGTWASVPGVDLKLDLDLDLDAPLPAGSLRAESGWFDLPPEKHLVDLVPQLKGFELEGRAMLDVQARIRGTDLIPDLVLALEDVSLHNRDMDLRIRGLSGQVALDALDPLQTSRDRDTYLRVQDLEKDFFALSDGLLFFRVHGDTLLVDKCSWLVRPEGRFFIYGSNWDLARHEGQVEMFFEDVDLLHFLSQSTRGRIEGSGLFYGHLSLGVEESGLKLGQGYVYALPGTGRLGIRDEDWLDTLLLYVRESMAGHEYLSLLIQRLEQALHDFEYDYFTLNLVQKKQDVVARIEIRGQGVEGDPPQRVGSLVLNISGLEDTLNRVLELRPAGEEEIRRTLDDWFDF